MEEGKDIVYVSLGTVCEYKEWDLNAIYYGLKRVGCKVIWSLKGNKLPEENPNFWVSEWVPQAEILANPAVKAGLAHCGFGGCLEFISASLPIVAYPHFGDQFTCNDILVSKKCAVSLFKGPRPIPKAGISKFFEKPIFDESDVFDKFTDVLSNPVYKQNMMKLMLAS